MFILFKIFISPAIFDIKLFISNNLFCNYVNPQHFFSYLVFVAAFFTFLILELTNASTPFLCPRSCRCSYDDSTGQTNVICDRLKTFPMFLPKTTGQLQILHSDLRSIPANAFSQAPQIQSVYIRFSTIENVSSLAFTNLHNISDIEFQRNNITRFETSAFLNLNVSSLTISENSIDVIQSRAFSSLKANDQIVCSSNNIGELSTASFSDVRETKTFQFQTNVVDVVRENCFTKFSSIEMFDFSNNAFGHVDPQVFDLNTKPIFFKNVMTCDCQISWIFARRVFSDFISINYCDKDQKLSLQEWNQKHKSLCYSTTDKIPTMKVTTKTSPSTLNMHEETVASSQRVPMTSSTTPFPTSTQNAVTTFLLSLASSQNSTPGRANTVDGIKQTSTTSAPSPMAAETSPAVTGGNEPTGQESRDGNGGNFAHSTFVLPILTVFVVSSLQ